MPADTRSGIGKRFKTACVVHHGQDEIVRIKWRPVRLPRSFSAVMHRSLRSRRLRELETRIVGSHQREVPMHDS
jgi:hypothetical protein